ncbi:MAG: group II intron maturase-specific domain-containing protein [Paludibacter sp.]|nr:group II intron maturase-specific domain-containing protein [Paludibacter sp.]
MASIQEKLKDVDGWVRNRLRCCIWKQWKKPEQRRKNLIRLGVDLELAYSSSRSRMGTWAVACSPILRTTNTVERLQKRGYESLFSYYIRIAPFLNELLYTRTVQIVRTYRDTVV